MATIAELRNAYLAGERRPADVITEIFATIQREGAAPVWISLADAETAIARARDIDLTLPLAGTPFAVKDNMDVAGMATTAGCPSYAHTPERSATVLARLIEAGAILIGKTNMDQFATGLVGTRSPYGACSSVFDPRYISGGSSSGSAVAVAKNLCSFSLGTDTAGSGRVPAAFNNLVGMKPTRGLLSAAGIVPACRSLDCVSIFAHTASDAREVWEIAQALDKRDPYSRTFSIGSGAAPWLNGSFRFGVPNDSHLQFFGDSQTPALYARAGDRLTELGGIRTEIDFTPFRETASLLYSGPWVAERFAAVGEHLMGAPDGANSVVAQIILGGSRYSAADAYKAAYRLEELKRAAAEQWTYMDVLLLPTAGTIYTHEAIASDPVRLNSNLGYYTNFVNLLDLAAIAVPAGFRSDGLPFGVSLIGPAFSDSALLTLGQRYLNEPSFQAAAPGCIAVAVAGAHLDGQPLNWELRERGARLARRCRTTSEYRLFALSTTPAKPGLMHHPCYSGPGIEVEIWNVPETEFGGFVAGIPAPLAIGSIQLETGEWVKGFVCEPAALWGCTEITGFGGWKNYLSRNSSDKVGAENGGVGRI